MARQPINQATLGRGGVALTFPAATPGDPANHHFIDPPLDGMILHVINNDAASQSVSFWIATLWDGIQVPSVAIPGKVVVIPAGGIRWFSGFRDHLYAQPTDGGRLWVNVTSVNLSLRILRMPTQIAGA
jgi:hypothetical protein